MNIIINFYIHDPSTKNHFLPIIEQLSQKNQYQINLIDLRNSSNESNIKENSTPKGNSTNQISIGFYGLSTNQIELRHQSQDTVKILYIESLVGERLAGINDHLPFDYIFVATKGAYQDLLSRFPYQPIILVGDTHYDYLSKINNNTKSSLSWVNLDQKQCCTCFLSPDDLKMDKELTNFENFTECLQVLDQVLDPNQTIKIRFHPRSSPELINYIEDFGEKDNQNQNHKRYLIDLSNDNNYNIIKSSSLTFSIGSTMGFESLILGIPSTFINLNNKFTYPYELYETDVIKVCTTIEELREFVKNPTHHLNLEFISLHKNAINETIKEIDNIIEVQLK